MKKKMKKLVLAKETVRSLGEPGDLQKIVGGSYRNTNCETCDSGFYTCPDTRNCTTVRSYLC